MWVSGFSITGIVVDESILDAVFLGTLISECKCSGSRPQRSYSRELGQYGDSTVGFLSVAF